MREKTLGHVRASLTMRQKIVATRRASVTTPVIKRIPPKGMQRACMCMMNCIKSMMATLYFEKLEQQKN
jgi:hypothetical protein